MTEILEGRETAGPGEEETGLTEVLDRVDEAADDQTAVVRARDLDLVDLDSDAETKEMPALSEAAPSGDDTAEADRLLRDTDPQYEYYTDGPVVSNSHNEGRQLIEPLAQ